MGLAEGRLHTARDFEAIEIGSVRIEVTPALHDWQQTDPWR
ncbi:hypothetical protein LCGC14_1937450, partial [marine sediment metagenome]